MSISLAVLLLVISSSKHRATTAATNKFPRPPRAVPTCARRLLIPLNLISCLSGPYAVLSTETVVVALEILDHGARSRSFLRFIELYRDERSWLVESLCFKHPRKHSRKVDRDTPIELTFVDCFTTPRAYVFIIRVFAQRAISRKPRGELVLRSEVLETERSRSIPPGPFHLRSTSTERRVNRDSVRY